MTTPNGNGHGHARPVRADDHAGDRDGDDAPAHGRKDRRRLARGRRDPRSLVTRLPVVLVLAAVVAAAVAVDARREAQGGEAAAPDPTPAAPLAMPAAPGPRAASSTWYCAAGTADEGGFADHTVTVQNPSDDDVEATITVYGGQVVGPEATPDEGQEVEDGSTTSTTTSTTTTASTTTTTAPAPATAPTPRAETVDIPAGERATVRLGDVLIAPVAAALVEVDAGVVAVEHTVVGEHGEDTGPCSTFAAPTWHVAWGSTARDARELVVLFNPFPSAATVDASFVTEEGRRQPVRFQGFPVPAGSVVAVDLGDDVTRADQVAATFQARTGRVVVERLQQYDGTLGPEGLAVTLGAPTAGTEWVFPDGEASAGSPATPAPEDRDDPREDDEALVTTERIVVYNPGDERAEVEVRAVPAGDDATVPQPFGLSLGPGRYEIVDYGGEERIEPGVPYATIVRSTNGQPVVAERVLLDQGPVPPRAASGTPRPGELAAAPGARLAADRWWLPSLADVGGDGRTVEIVVFNAGDARRSVQVTPSPASPAEDAPTAPDAVEVEPGSRAAVELDADTVASAGGAVVIADGPVVVERVVRAADGRRVAAHPAIPLAPGATVLGAG